MNPKKYPFLSYNFVEHVHRKYSQYWYNVLCSGNLHMEV